MPSTDSALFQVLLSVFGAIAAVVVQRIMDNHPGLRRGALVVIVLVVAFAWVSWWRPPSAPSPTPSPTPSTTPSPSSTTSVRPSVPPSAKPSASAVSQPPAPSPCKPPATVPAAQTEDSLGDFDFRLGTITSRGRTISVKALVTNTGKTQPLFTALEGLSYGPYTSDILDDCGESFRASKVTIAGTEYRAEIAAGTTVALEASFVLPNPERARLDRLQSVTLRFAEPQRTSIEFRSVPIQR